MDQQHTEQQGKGFTGKHMLMVMVLFFGCIIAVNLVLVFFANKSWTGLIVKNSYVASQHFNSQVAAQKELEQSGWKGTLDYEAGRFTLTLNQRDASLSGLDVSGQLRRPVHEGEDRKLDFLEGPNGRYSATTQLQPGKWKLEISAKGEDGDFKQVYRFFVTPNGKLH